MTELLQRRPIMVALAGPNGAGKSSFYSTYLKQSGLPFINSDQISLQTGVDAYRAAELADEIRRALVEQQESFIFETVFSDPVGAKLQFLKETEAKGYSVVLVFIGIDGPQICEARVAMRVSKGGHDVPANKIAERYSRTMKNLQRAFLEIGNIRVYENSDLDRPYRLVASKDAGREVEVHPPTPGWLKRLLPSRR
ncbi:MAG TPA: zeta toxin family protein [Terracidiphilus sp.]|nr:zeta toxin family protein [Terracidiphilus sp.]